MHTCPNCGYCPTCHRPGFGPGQAAPWVPQTSGYTCWACGRWVGTFEYHICTGYPRYTVYSTNPPYTVTYSTPQEKTDEVPTP